MRAPTTRPGHVVGSLDLIVIHHADAGSTRACVEEMAGELELLEGTGARRILVVDNGPTGEVDDLARPDRIEVLPAPRRGGFGANVNLAAAHSNAELVLMLNDDARIDAASMAVLAGALADPTVGAVGPRILDGSGIAAASAWHFPDLAGVIAFAWRQDAPPWVQSAVERPTGVDVISAAVLMLRRETFVDDLGGFDPGYFMFSEDADLSRRLADRGLRRLVLPAATATHVGGASTTGHERRRDVEQWRSRSLYWRRHHGPPARFGIRALYASSYAVGALVAVGRGGRGESGVQRARRLLFLSRCALRTPPDPGLRELAAGWTPPPR